jgi:hypothetical protein
MSQLISLQIPDAVYEAIHRAAAASKSTPEQWIVETLRRQLPIRAEPTNGAGHSAAEQFRGLFGAVHSGETRSADNQRIDTDLARAYAGLDSKEP